MEIGVTERRVDLTQLPGGTDVQAQPDTASKAAAGAAPQPVLSGDSLTVTGGAVDTLVSKLRAETDDRREDSLNTRFACAFNVALGRIALADAKQQEIVNQLGGLTMEYAAELEAYNRAVAAAGDSSEADNDDEVRKHKQRMEEIETEIQALTEQLDEISKSAVTAELRDVTLSLSKAYDHLDRTRPDEKEDLSRGIMDMMVKVLGGEDLRTAFEEAKKDMV